MTEPRVVIRTLDELQQRRHDLHLLTAFGNPGGLQPEDEWARSAELAEIDWLLGDDA